MRIDVLSLFPEMFQAPLDASIIKRAIDSGIVTVKVHNIRDYAHDKHRTVDDCTYGGGPGMVLKAAPIFEAVEAVKSEIQGAAGGVPVVLLTPQGRLFSQQMAQELSRYSHIVLVCGHYEGIDERVREHVVTDEISIGDYVLTGGELPAMVVIDAVVRLLPGALGSDASPLDDSHASGLLEYPQYTRPPAFRGWPVPDVLLSGDHARIAAWRREQTIRRTLERRPDLINKVRLSSQERELVENLLSSANRESNLV